MIEKENFLGLRERRSKEPLFRCDKQLRQIIEHHDCMDARAIGGALDRGHVEIDVGEVS
jgi:hypothetical protein